ncbi:hypothetical protein J437_LFUL011514 [Ladona fulva]|uniref:PiggyBac transposable element-derived protein domain-containing protein n=1 Tax=Ladona fulva TaxID=123851 RepID=A0A8K0KAM4_LADFU|nr:hypothetical protein J437_LFUL011514 [Ladona fulva]
MMDKYHKRYISVKRYLHFSDNSTYDPNNHPNPKLNKIWPVYERLNKKFQDAYTPERNDINIVFQECAKFALTLKKKKAE